MLNLDLKGWQLAYDRPGRAAEPRSRPALVLIHGYPLDHSIWTPLIPGLQEKFDLLLPDLRGFGRSGLLGGGYRMEDLAFDLLALLDTLGIQQAALAGHSMGGYVALAFARLYPQRTLGLGLVASQAVADDPVHRAGRLATAGRIEVQGVGEVAESMPQLLSSKPKMQAALKQLILQQQPPSLAAALRAMAERPDSTPFLSAFDFPVVIVHGLADRIIPIERAREVRAAVRYGSLVEIEAVGHMPMMEAPQPTSEALLSGLLKIKT
jgi:pimeloyl-ACP methyl ester carboxylesterase